MTPLFIPLALLTNLGLWAGPSSALEPTVLEGKIRPQGNLSAPRRTRRSHPTQIVCHDNGPWGHSLTTTKNGFRIVSRTLNGSKPADASHEQQHQQLITTLTSYSFDVFGAQEIRLKPLSPSTTTGAVAGDASQVHPFFSFPAYNKNTTRRTPTFGGTATFVASHATARMIDHDTRSIKP
jgi:hypothetical protein